MFCAIYKNGNPSILHNNYHTLISITIFKWAMQIFINIYDIMSNKNINKVKARDYNYGSLITINMLRKWENYLYNTLYKYLIQYTRRYQHININISIFRPYFSIYDVIIQN